MESRTLPPHLPVQDPGDYRWVAAGWADEAHAFPPVEDGRLPGPASCGVRWNVRYAHAGGGHCPTCIGELRDQLRAVSVALAAAGIRLDAPAQSDPNDCPICSGMCADGHPEPTEDQRGDQLRGNGPMTVATRPTCEATLSDRFRISASGVGFDAVPCGQTVGVATFTDATRAERHACSREGHRANVERRFGVAPRAPRGLRVAGCAGCRDGGGPPHEASPRCESGRRNHCSCDVCF